MIDAVLRAARRAGRAIEEVQRSGFYVESKGDAGPVTEADRRADAILRHELLGLESAGWLSEETVDDATRLGRDALWVVDPLDGTKEFVDGIPQYCVAIGLVRAGEPVLGVVHNPATDDTFWAERGRGAWRNGTAIQVAEGRCLLASRSELKRGEFDPFHAGWELSPVGSIQLKLALVAAGDAAVTLSRGPKHEWDVCAGALLVAEAGGRVTDLLGGPLRYNQPFPKVKGILAGAPAAYARAAGELTTIGPSDRMDEFTRAPRPGRK